MDSEIRIKLNIPPNTDRRLHVELDVASAASPQDPAKAVQTSGSSLDVVETCLEDEMLEVYLKEVLGDDYGDGDAIPLAQDHPKYACLHKVMKATHRRFHDNAWRRKK